MDALQRQLRVTYSRKEAKMALKSAIPSMGFGIIINTSHGDLSLHGDDARAVMELVKKLAVARARTVAIP